MRKTAITLCASVLVALTLGSFARTASADGTYQTLPFSQNWANAGLITVNDDWSGVPGILGYLGDSDPGFPSNVDPQTLTADVAVAVDVIANQANPNTLSNGGVAEFAITDPVVALNGSSTADAPYITLHLNTTGLTNIALAYNLRDIDGSIDNSAQQYNAQYRLGGAGAWTNIPGTYVADASGGPSLATLVTPINVVLPGACDNAAQVQVRIMTTNASGNDEWVGIDDISVTGDPIAPPAVYGVNLGWSNCSTAIATSNRSFTCDDNGSSFSLVGSFKSGENVSDFVAVAAAVDVTTSGGSIPAWFQFGPGGCRDGEIGVNVVGALLGCTNPYSGASQGGGLLIESTPSPDRFRVRIQWARDLPGALNGSVLNSAFVLGISTANSFDEGDGSCTGCNVPACAVLNAVEVFSQSQGRVRILESADVRNWAGWQGGTGNCPGATPSRNSSWGQVKATYR